MKYTKVVVSLLSLTFLASCGQKESVTPTDRPTEPVVTDTTPTEVVKPSEVETNKLEDKMFADLAKSFGLKGFDHAAMYLAGLLPEPIELTFGLEYSWTAEFFAKTGGELVLKGDTLTTPEDIEEMVNGSTVVYSKTEEGLLEARALSMSNEIVSQAVVDDQDNPLEYFENPFAYVYAEDFAATETFAAAANRKYAFELREDAQGRADLLNAFGRLLIGSDLVTGTAEDSLATLQFYTDGFKVTGLELVIDADPNEVTGEADAPIIGEKFAFDIVAEGDEVSVSDVQPVAGTADPVLDAALKKLAAAKSYTNSLELRDGSGEVVDTASVKVDEHAAVIDYSNGTGEAFLSTDSGLIGGLKATGEDKYELVDLPADSALSQLLPDLNLSALLFEKQEDGSYLLKVDTAGLVLSTDYSMMIQSELELTSLKVTVEGESITLASEVASIGTTVTYVEKYTGIDTTSVALTEEDFVAPEPLPGLLGCLSQEDVNYITQYFVEEHLGFIPTVDGYTSASIVDVTFEDGSEAPAFAVDCGDAASATSALAAYSEKLNADANWNAHASIPGVWAYKEKVSVEFTTGVEEVFFALQVVSQDQYILILPGYYTAL